MITTILFAALSMQTRESVPPADRPAYVAAAISAVAQRDAKALRTNFPSIGIVYDDRSGALDAQTALDILSGCSEEKVTHLVKTTYVIDYTCPQRHAAAKGCDSGDIFVMASKDDATPSFVMAHRRKLTLECPPPAPPAPPPGWKPKGFDDPKTYYWRTKLILDSALAGQDQEVARLGRPTGKIYFTPTVGVYAQPISLNGANLRDLLQGCSRQGKTEVDTSGATMSFRCSNAKLKGMYSVDFDFFGELLNKVMILTPEDRAKLDAAAEKPNG